MPSERDEKRIFLAGFALLGMVMAGYEKESRQNFAEESVKLADAVLDIIDQKSPETPTPKSRTAL